MVELPHPWNAYASLQTSLRRGCRVDDRSWGTEAAMDRILVSLQDNHPLTSDEIVRAAASERRRERNRTRLRLVHLAGSELSPHPENAIAARQELGVARSKLSGGDWSVLRHVAEGYGYGELASAIGGTPERLRVRVLRLRRKLTAVAA